MALSGSRFVVVSHEHDDGLDDDAKNGAMYIGNTIAGKVSLQWDGHIINFRHQKMNELKSFGPMN